ncbi:peroxiredoxin [Leptospirillum ferrooxidans]|uniref:Thioredoxin peroxidase n=1 Tax=Leptospirillum ferrooxidans (strain C2-3) TaxID=1162668 RepID=I0IMN6_LEPFC|nr:peroxiredoxin [Leptospirillum ferrooxidans]BAM06535.1 alkyl hydroperoxide reductase [Leptospirillum ferrooxidans C2-3]
MSHLIGTAAPDFTAQAVMGDGSINEKFQFSQYLKGSIGVLFFWPLDFTFVCPTEIIAFDHRLAEFEKRGVKVVGASVDSVFTHAAWRNTPVNMGGIGPVKFPIVADLSKSVSRAYGVLLNDEVALRGTFLIDAKGIIRHQLVNDLPLGREIGETLRMVDALKFHEEHGEVCPAGWQKGQEAIKATEAGIKSYLKDHAASL